MFFLLDVSGSMSDRDRQLAKTFFFWVAAGLRREYKALDIVFVAHTTEAWEFSEADFFKVAGSGGTVASVGLAKVREIMHERFDPASCNVYLFYASDGDNASDDRAPAARRARSHRQGGALLGLCGDLRRGSQLAERDHGSVRGRRRGGAAMRALFRGQPRRHRGAVRHFFTAEAHAGGDAEAGGSAP